MPPYLHDGIMARLARTHLNGMISNPNHTNPSQENNTTKGQE